MSAVPTSIAAASTATPTSLPTTRAMEYIPVGLFGSVMGTTGLSIAWSLATTRFGVSPLVADAVAVVAVLAFVAVGIAYAVKSICAWDAVRAEFAHPIAGALFGTILISILLLPIVVARVDLAVARCLWAVGAVGMVAFAWRMVDRWMGNRQQVAHATPAWIVPVVGLLDVPLAMPALHLQSMHGLMVFSLAVGLFFAVPLFTLIFSRLVFEPPLPDALQPSLMILLAPFAVGTSTYMVTTGQADLFAESLYALTLFVFTVLVGRLRDLARCCPFRVSWWAVSFPIAATAVAALRLSIAEPGWLTDGLAVCLLAFATVVIAGLGVRTLYGVATGELRRLSV